MRKKILRFFYALILVFSLYSCAKDHSKREVQKEKELFSLVLLGSVQEIQSLLRKGVNPNYQDRYGYAPLHRVSFWGRVQVVKLLLKWNADPNIQNVHGITALHSASSLCKKENHEVIRFLVLNGANPSARDRSGGTPLHNSVLLGCMESVRFLVKHGADPFMETVNGKTPLDLAIERKNAEMIRYLQSLKRL